MTEIYIITVTLMMLTIRSFELVNQIFNSSSIQSHQRAVVQRQQCFDWFVTSSYGQPGNRCNSFTNYGGKSELFPKPSLMVWDGHSAG